MEMVEVYVRLKDRRNALGEVQFSTKQGALLDVWATAGNMDEADYILKNLFPERSIKYVIAARLSRLSIAQLISRPAPARVRDITSHYLKDQRLPQ
jgi:hypothetical protein